MRIPGYLPRPISRRLCPELALLLLLFGTTPAIMADLLRDGADLQRQGRHQEAFRLFQAAADANDPVGHYGIGVLYFQGNAVTRDIRAANRHFRIAAEQQYAPAAYNLGNAYLRGHGVEQDLDQAEHWWRIAAERGYARAQFNIGALLHTQGSSAELREEGIAWLRSAAAQGFAKARQNLQELDEPLNYADIQPELDRQPQRSEAQLMTRSPRAYTLQLFSSPGTAATQRFIAKHALGNTALVFRFIKDTSLWSGVAFGVYQQRADAQETLRALKPALLAPGPWVRKIADVQQRIRHMRETLPRSQSSH